jgi:hypothetical protein
MTMNGTVERLSNLKAAGAEMHRTHFKLFRNRIRHDATPATPSWTVSISTMAAAGFGREIR